MQMQIKHNQTPTPPVTPPTPNPVFDNGGKCPICGNYINRKKRICPRCGNNLDPSMGTDYDMKLLIKYTYETKQQLLGISFGVIWIALFVMMMFKI